MFPVISLLNALVKSAVVLQLYHFNFFTSSTVCLYYMQEIATDLSHFRKQYFSRTFKSGIIPIFKFPTYSSSIRGPVGKSLFHKRSSRSVLDLLSRKVQHMSIRYYDSICHHTQYKLRCHG